MKLTKPSSSIWKSKIKFGAKPAALFFDLSNEIFDNGHDIAPSFARNIMGFLYNFGGLLFQFGISGDRLFEFLILPAQKPHRQFFFLLSDKAHNEMPKLPKVPKIKAFCHFLQ